MGNFFKALISVMAVFGAVIGALVVIDKVLNKHRIKGDYLECDSAEEFEEYEEEVE